MIVTSFPPGTTLRFRTSNFNRWGKQVFRTTDAQETWHGRTYGVVCAEGIFFYTLSYSFLQQAVRNISGLRTIIRKSPLRVQSGGFCTAGSYQPGSRLHGYRRYAQGIDVGVRDFASLITNDSITISGVVFTQKKAKPPTFEYLFYL